jgi:hypothetical protein
MTSALPNDTHHEDRTMNLNLKVRHIVAALTIAAAGTASANVTLYERDNFGGREINVNQSVTNLAGTNFNDRARSAIVDSGRWEVCVDANFNGGCQVLGPGRYPDLGGLDGRVSSVRPVAEPVAAYRGNDGNRQRQGDRRSASATLYEGGNLSGRSYSLGNRTMANLDGTGFNDRASSLHVDSGYWVFCSDANFAGDCRTFGPGDYASLPLGLNNMISSGRRISDDYPYDQRPDWQR